MRIVVTGTAGFIGSHLCERLAARGYSVVGVDCFADYYAVRRKEQNARELAAVGVRVKRLDLAIDSLRGALADAAVIYHLAAQPGLSPHITAEQYYRNNLVLTQALVKACCALHEMNGRPARKRRRTRHGAYQRGYLRFDRGVGRDQNAGAD